MTMRLIQETGVEFERHECCLFASPLGVTMAFRPFLAGFSLACRIGTPCASMTFYAKPQANFVPSSVHPIIQQGSSAPRCGTVFGHRVVSFRMRGTAKLGQH